MVAWRHLGWVLVLGCTETPSAPPNHAMIASAAVDVEAARQRVLAAFELSCTRGTVECDGAPRTTRPTTTSPPSGAAGFDLGMLMDEAEQRCTAAGQLWFNAPHDVFSCTGSAGEHLPFHVDLVECAGRVCRLVLSEHVSVKAFERFAEIETQLEKSYGAEHLHDVATPTECSEAPARCIRDGRARAHDAWRWDTGHELTATLVSPSGEDAFLVLGYSAPAFADMLRTRGL